jgi:hypothetical protein
MIEVILKRFEAPDETRLMEKGEFEVVHLGGLTVGRATYDRWARAPSRAHSTACARWA